MAAAGGSAPPKPWERAPSAGASPFRPASAMPNTAAVVESAGVAQSGEKNEKKLDVPNALSPDRESAGRQMPPRPWERNNYGGYNSMTNYNQYSGNSYLSNPYGSSIGGLYGNNYGSNYRGIYGVGSTYGGGMYGGGYGLGNSLGGGGLYGNYGGGMYGSGYGMGGMGGTGSLPYGQGDPNNPFGGGPPPEPPTFWQSMLRVLHGVVNFFGRISFLVDQNTQAFHFFITALLQLCDRAGILYGELARFVLRVLGFWKPRFHPKAPGLQLPGGGRSANYLGEGPKEAGGAWDNLWSEEGVAKAG